MNDEPNGTLTRLLADALGEDHARDVLATLTVHPPLLEESGGRASRAVIAQALAMMLFDDLLARVPSARAYVDSVRAEGRRVTFDHGALRTVKAPETGALPPGDAAFARLLGPLGYGVAEIYDLSGIAMTGRAYTHVGYPEQVPQYFVSELHPERFSQSFQEAVARVLSTSRDPLTPEAKDMLAALEAEGALRLDDAARLLPALARCFARQHEAPSLADYEILLAESAEMAWIATEGNTFNHATDRVGDVEALAEALRRSGQPVKDSVEVSASGRLRQTAFRAAKVAREFVGAEGAKVTREVPGSFYEFISRDPLPDGSGLDLGFDAGNAQGIFKMTAAGR